MSSKDTFREALTILASTLSDYASTDAGEWTIKGFIDTRKEIYTISSDTKVVSKILEIHLFPKILRFAEEQGFEVVLADHQNYYPDLSFVSKIDQEVKFAVDFKTTYRNPRRPWLCNGFTLGSHGRYFTDRASTKNIQFPYGSYLGHFCLGVIYDRLGADRIDETRSWALSELDSITSVISNLQFFVAEKWRIASDKRGSGNTANIGSIQRITDIVSGNGMFAELGEEWFDDYWMNYGKITIKTQSGEDEEDYIARRVRLLSWRRHIADSAKKQFPMKYRRTIVPPIKCQGIKTKLVPWIRALVPVDFDGMWIEPFLGSGVVVFNILPKRALLADSNPHLINFYEAISVGAITPASTRRHLESEGAKLLRSDGERYYTVRERFNRTHDPLDFLFLNRACFNGLIRFNRKGQFNVPFCRKPNRFSRSYITKICNQVKAVADILTTRDFTFATQDLSETISMAQSDDFIYCDPPYVGRHTDYFNDWNEQSEIGLAQLLSSVPCRFILSTWHSNRYRKNPFIDALWSEYRVLTREHFYHIGAREDNRNPMIEAIVMNYEAASVDEAPNETVGQGRLLEQSTSYRSSLCR